MNYPPWMNPPSREELSPPGGTIPHPERNYPPGRYYPPWMNPPPWEELSHWEGLSPGMNYSLGMNYPPEWTIPSEWTINYPSPREELSPAMNCPPQWTILPGRLIPPDFNLELEFLVCRIQFGRFFDLRHVFVLIFISSN